MSVKIQLSMDENIGEDDSIPITVTSETEIKSVIKGYHAYKHLWKLVVNEELNAAMEPGNVVDKYTVKVNSIFFEQTAMVIAL